jgi:hypothetical protein
MKDIMPSEKIINKVYLVRNIKVMLDSDLAKLYGVETAYLKRQVRRNIERFPDDFMFELTKEEFDNWRCQFVTSNADKIGLRYRPMVFTEQGVAMLSSVLKSKRAIFVNIQIMRIFTKMRKMLSSNEELKGKIESIEKKYDKQFRIIFDAIKQLLTDEEKPKKRIGFK